MKAGVTSSDPHPGRRAATLGIRVNTIAPDISRPRGWQPSLQEGPPDPEVAAAGHRRADGGPGGTYEDVGGCALFLASDLSSFVTGTTLHRRRRDLASSGWFNWPDAGYLNHPPKGVLEYLLGS